MLKTVISDEIIWLFMPAVLSWNFEADKLL